MKTVIHNGKIILPEKIIARGFVFLENGTIRDIGPESGAKKYKSVSGGEIHFLDAEKGYVSPGFIDLHIHGVGMCDLNEHGMGALESAAKILASQGVTSFLPAVVTSPTEEVMSIISTVKSARSARSARATRGANVLGINMEGPYINPKKKGAHPESHIKLPDTRELKKMISESDSLIKIMTIAPELPGVDTLLEILKENAIVPAIGHTMASFEETMAAIDKGFHYISHTFNAMTPFHHRAPGAIGAILMREEVTTEIIADGIHVHPAVVKFLTQIKRPEKIILVTDALLGLMRKEDKTKFAGREIKSNGIAVYDSEGTLMGGVVPMNKAVANMMEFTGLDLTFCVKSATINPARVLGIDKTKGSIEVGKDADLVIFDEDLRVKATIVGGEIV